MGRWGDGLYDSDDALDFFSTITGRLERELAHWLMPERVAPQTMWLAQIFAGLEAMIMLTELDWATSNHLEYETIIQRWKIAFLEVWDGEWSDNPNYNTYQYNTPAYRKEHRSIVIKQFEYLEGVVHYWTNLGTDKQVAEPAPFDEKLPYFPYSGRLVGELMGSLEREIIYCLSAEKRSQVIFLNVIYEIGVSVDVLAFLCERYQKSPGIREGVVEGWRTITTEIYKTSFDEKKIFDPNDGYYRNMMAAFDRLAALARQYPAEEW